MTGEMSHIDQETGVADDGSIYPAHAEICKRLRFEGYRASLRPFDLYRGPYIFVSAYGIGFKIWMVEESEQPYVYVESSKGDKKLAVPLILSYSDYERVITWLKLRALVPFKPEREFTSEELRITVIHLPTGRIIDVGQANREAEDWPHCLEVYPSYRYESVVSLKEVPKPLERDGFDTDDIEEVFRDDTGRSLELIGFMDDDIDYPVFKAEDDGGLYVFYKGEEIECRKGCRKTGRYLASEDQTSTEVTVTWKTV